MSATVVHLLMGALAGLGLRVKWRYIPLIMALAILPDIDHIDALEALGFGARITMHNIFFCVVLPVAIALILLFRQRASVQTQRIALAAIPVLSSHLIFDLYPYIEGTMKLSKVGLFYPLSDALYYAAPFDSFIVPNEGIAYDPASFALLLFLGIIALTSLWSLLLAFKAGWLTPPAWFRRQAIVPAIAVIAVVLISIFPVMAALQVVQPYNYPQEADVRIVSAVINETGVATVTVEHFGGDVFDARALTLKLLNADNATVRTAYNPAIMRAGSTWTATFSDLDSAGSYRTVLLFKTTAHAYDTAAFS